MKKNFFPVLFLTIFVLLTTGCKEEQCKSFVPADKEISWTDYNTVSSLWDYFGCYAETARMHEGDTLKVVGYVVPGYQGIAVPFDDSPQRLLKEGLSIGDYYDIPRNKQNTFLLVFCPMDSNMVNKFQGYQYGQLVYVTAIHMGRIISYLGHCCDGLRLRPIEIKRMEGESGL